MNKKNRIWTNTTAETIHELTGRANASRAAWCGVLYGDKSDDTLYIKKSDKTEIDAGYRDAVKLVAEARARQRQMLNSIAKTIGATVKQ